MKVPRLAGVIVFCAPERFAQVARFYAEVLRLPVRNRRDDFVNFSWGDDDAELRLTVKTHDAVHGPNEDPLHVVVNLSVEDIEGWHERLTEAGVRCLRPPEREHWGGCVATYADPDGHLVQLLQLP